MKLTKIVATIGPSSQSPETIELLINNGVNIFRFNFKHNTAEWHHEKMKLVRSIAKKMGNQVGILLDLQGPEIRVKLSAAGHLEITKDVPIDCDSADMRISHPSLLSHIKNGQHIVINDGQFSFVFKREGGKSYLIPSNSGTLNDMKSMNIPGGDFPLPAMVDNDIVGVKLAGTMDVDFIALSFVRSAADIAALKAHMKKHGAHSQVVSKIETKKAIQNIDEITAASDAIMIGRGDLGVEIPIEEVPYYQKKLIRNSFERGVPVITATQMLESMIENPYPTRAEVSDIANAAYDLTDAVMLSAESASGKYPLLAVKMLAKTVSFHEKIPFKDIRLLHNFHIRDLEELMCDAAYNVYHKSENHNAIAAFLVFSTTGKTARMISRYRPQVPIYAVTFSGHVANSLTMNYGVYPVVMPYPDRKDAQIRTEDITNALALLTKQKHLKKGSHVVVVHGSANTIRIMTV